RPRTPVVQGLQAGKGIAIPLRKTSGRTYAPQNWHGAVLGHRHTIQLRYTKDHVADAASRGLCGVRHGVPTCVCAPDPDDSLPFALRYDRDQLALPGPARSLVLVLRGRAR